jgi:alpha-L-fucosidase
MMQPWFQRAKLGIFLHWGLYCVKGIPESWSFFRGEISYEDYMAQCAGFSARRYDPEAWAGLFRDAGARYAVLTAKHHDGFALWDTKVSDLSAVHRTPAARDLIGPYCDALRRAGLHVGLYFSHADWSHPDYPTLFPPGGGPKTHTNRFAYPPKRANPARWAKFLQFHRAQLRELCTEFDPELLWFDGDWERSADQWKMAELRDQLQAWRPGVVVNSRMGGHGDYATPEQGLPIHSPKGPWEFCMTMNDSWGYHAGDNNQKPLRQIIRVFAECIGMGGNLLLDVGPKADGTITKPQADRLRGLGAWIRRNEEAVYPTGAGLPHGHFYGASTLSEDRTLLYLFLFDQPLGEICVKGIRNTVKSATLLGSGRALPHRKSGGATWLKIPGALWIKTPSQLPDPNCNVIRLELEGPLDLYTGSGGAIESN